VGVSEVGSAVEGMLRTDRSGGGCAAFVPAALADGWNGG